MAMWQRCIAFSETPDAPFFLNPCCTDAPKPCIGASMHRRPMVSNTLFIVDLLVFALRIFCPIWTHVDGNDLREMIKYYQHTKEILRELEPDKTAAITFDSITKNARMKERVGNGTTRGTRQILDNPTCSPN